MKEYVNLVSDDAVEIVMPPRNASHVRCAVVCLCCERAGMPMDDDGCGICDACLGLPLPTVDDRDGLEVPAPPTHLSLTTRNR